MISVNYIRCCERVRSAVILCFGYGQKRVVHFNLQSILVVHLFGKEKNLEHIKCLS